MRMKLPWYCTIVVAELSVTNRAMAITQLIYNSSDIVRNILLTNVWCFHFVFVTVAFCIFSS